MEVEQQLVEAPKEETLKPKETLQSKDEEEASKPKDVKDSKTKDVKDSKTKDAKGSKAKEAKDPKAVGKMDSFITFKAPEKSPKKQKTEPQQKTPIKIDVLEEVAMPSWSDNSNTEIIKPAKDTESTKDSEIMIIDDSEDIKLVYENTVEAKSTSTSPDSPKANTVTKKSTEQSSPETAKTEETPKPAFGTPKCSNTKVSQPSTPKSSLNTENNFFKQAKVTDVKDQAVKSAPSPKAPRRVSFVTLSSPKNAKKK